MSRLVLQFGRQVCLYSYYYMLGLPLQKVYQFIMACSPLEPLESQRGLVCNQLLAYLVCMLDKTSLNHSKVVIPGNTCILNSRMKCCFKTCMIAGSAIK